MFHEPAQLKVFSVNHAIKFSLRTLTRLLFQLCSSWCALLWLPIFYSQCIPMISFESFAITSLKMIPRTFIFHLQLAHSTTCSSNYLRAMWRWKKMSSVSAFNYCNQSVLFILWCSKLVILELSQQSCEMW